MRAWRQPDPGPPAAGSRCTDIHVNNAGLHAPAAMELDGRHKVREQQPRALLEDTGLQSPVTANNRRLHRDPHHRCTRMYKRSNLHPVPRSNQPPQSSNYELDRPGCDTRPLRRGMSFATGVDKVVLTRCVQHLHLSR
jgi:hypothetical protein